MIIWTQSFIINRYKNPMIYKLLIAVCFFVGQNSYGAASGETEDKEASIPQVVVKEKTEEPPPLTLKAVKERNRRASVNKQVYPERGLIEYRDHFMERVKKWEREIGHPMQCDDLLRPYLENIGDEKKKIRLCSIYENVKDPKFMCSKEKEFWIKIQKYILESSITAYRFKRYRVNRYDELFSFQILLENYRIGDIVDGDRDIRNSLKYLGSKLQKPTEKRIEESKRVYREFFSDIKKVIYENSKQTPGMITDTPSEGIQGTLGRPLIWMGVIRPPFDPPTTSPDANLRYLHEVDGKGFSVFLHLFKGMREEIAPFTAYGMKKEYRVPPFIQTGYRLPPSMILEGKGEEGGKVIKLDDASGAATGGAATGGASDREGLRYRGKGSASGAGESAGIGLREEGVVLAKASSPGSSAAAKAEGSMEAGAASRPASPVAEEEDKPLLASEEDGK